MDAVRQNDIRFLYPFVNLADRPSFIRQMYDTLKDFGVSEQEIRHAAEKAFAELNCFKD